MKFCNWERPRGKVRMCRMELAHLFLWNSGMSHLAAHLWSHPKPMSWAETWYLDSLQWTGAFTGSWNRWLLLSPHWQIQIKHLLPWFPQETLESWLDSSPASAIATSLSWLSVLPAGWAPMISPYSLNWAPQIILSLTWNCCQCIWTSSMVRSVLWCPLLSLSTQAELLESQDPAWVNSRDLES